jgi:hypothetical protein
MLNPTFNFLTAAAGINWHWKLPFDPGYLPTVLTLDLLVSRLRNFENLFLLNGVVCEKLISVT